MAHRPKKSIAVAYLDVGQITLRKRKDTSEVRRFDYPGGADALKAVLSDNNKYPVSGSNLGDGMRHIGYDITAGDMDGDGLPETAFCGKWDNKNAAVPGVLFRGKRMSTD